MTRNLQYAGMSLAVRKENQDITSIDSLKGKSVGVLKGTMGEKLAVKSPKIDNSLLLCYVNNDKRLQGLEKGDVDASIVHFLIKDLPNIKLVGEPLSESYYGVVAKIGNTSLMRVFNKTLRVCWGRVAKFSVFLS